MIKIDQSRKNIALFEFKMKDFIHCERWDGQHIIDLLNDIMIRSFVYEGNQYWVEKKDGNNIISIIDDVARENIGEENAIELLIDKDELIERIEHEMELIKLK